MGVVLRAAFVTKSSLGGRTLTQQMLPGSALKTSLLMPFLVLEFGQLLLLPSQFLLNPLVLLIFQPSLFLLRINNNLLRCL